MHYRHREVFLFGNVFHPRSRRMCLPQKSPQFNLPQDLLGGRLRDIRLLLNVLLRGHPKDHPPNHQSKHSPSLRLTPPPCLFLLLLLFLEVLKSMDNSTDASLDVLGLRSDRFQAVLLHQRHPQHLSFPTLVNFHLPMKKIQNMLL